MKLTYDDKVQIYELRKQGYSIEKLSNKFGINNSPNVEIPGQGKDYHSPWGRGIHGEPPELFQVY